MEKEKEALKKISVKLIIFQSVLILILLISLIFLIIFNKKNNFSANDIFNKNIASVVELKAFDDEETVSYGSAVAIEDNLLITNAHVLSYKKNLVLKNFDNVQIRLATEIEYISATIKKIDYELDLAILKIDSNNLNPIKTYNKKIVTGEKIYAMGNAQNYGISIMEGIVAKNEAIVQADGKTVTAIQCDINITEGNSGGALLNKNGQLVGITTFRLKDSKNNVVYGISFAIPIGTINNFINNN